MRIEILQGFLFIVSLPGAKKLKTRGKLQKNHERLFDSQQQIRRISHSHSLPVPKSGPLCVSDQKGGKVPMEL